MYGYTQTDVIGLHKINRYLSTVLLTPVDKSSQNSKVKTYQRETNLIMAPGRSRYRPTGGRKENA